jgi:hypothetical protein
LEYIYVFGDRDYVEEEIPDNLDGNKADWFGFRAWRGCEDFRADDCDTLDFDYEFDDDDTDWGHHLWIYVEESGDPARPAQLVQKFLRRFRPDQCWGLTFAQTCSKLRVGDFGGGAVFVTADKIKWNNAFNFVEEEQRSFNVKDGKA